MWGKKKPDGVKQSDPVRSNLYVSQPPNFPLPLTEDAINANRGAMRLLGTRLDPLAL